MARLVIGFQGRGRLDDLARACEVVEAIDGDLQGPRLAEALRLDDRFAGYSHHDVMELATTPIGAGIVSDEGLFPNA